MRCYDELTSIRNELGSIISELENISAGIKRDFTGIGNDRCAASIDKALSQYYSVSRKLNNLDTNTVTESFAKTHKSGGGTR